MCARENHSPHDAKYFLRFIEKFEMGGLVNVNLYFLLLAKCLRFWFPGCFARSVLVEKARASHKAKEVENESPTKALCTWQTSGK